MPTELLHEQETRLIETADERIERVIAEYRDHINPGLAKVMQFAGFADIEEFAEGCLVSTAGGTDYLDFLGGYGVFSLGHRHPKIVQAVHDQLDKMPLSTHNFFNEQQGALAAELARLAPGDLQYTFFSNSGAEAVEAALKFARAATGRPEFVSTEGAYHGKTLGALSVTGRAKYRQPFEPLLPTCHFVPFNDIEAMRGVVSDQTAAVIIEVIQGEGGIHVAAPGYLKALRELCDQHGALLIVDEIQTGLGRTGTLFAIEQEDVVPDIMTLAKALGGGVMPIGATMATRAVWEKMFTQNPLLHTSTFGGNPMACAAGLAALEVIAEENLAEKATERGEQLLTALRRIQQTQPKVITDVRGRGLMIGVEFALREQAELTISLLASSGIIAAYTLNNPNVIRIEPPLVVTAQQCETFLEAFSGAAETAAALIADLE